MKLDEDEKLFMKFVKDNYRLCTGTKLEGWKEENILKMYRFHKRHPLAKIVMGYKGPVVISKEDMRGE